MEFRLIFRSEQISSIVIPLREIARRAQDDVEGVDDNFMNTYRDASKYAGTAILPPHVFYLNSYFPHRDTVCPCVNRQQ